MSDNVQIIVKLVERCNLDCSYCYMYHGADQSWRSRPALLSQGHQDELVDRCAAYLAANDYRTVTLEFHGGEPLMIGLDSFRDLLVQVRDRLGQRAHLCIQTNGVLLTETWLDLFEEFGVSWSISCDGPAKVNDRFRLDHMGRPSLSKVETAIQISLNRKSNLFGGVLAVIDPTSSPRDVVHYFHKLGLNECDLLLPDASYAAPPTHLPDFSMAQVQAYLIEAFDVWIAIGDPKFRIRIFAHMIKSLFGSHSGLDAFGGELWGMIVVESDGSYQHVDVMRINGLEEADTGLNLADCSLDSYLDQTKGTIPEACDTCKSCSAFSVCGGGYMPHRFDGNSYDNPSVYCEVLFNLIAYINSYLENVTPPQMWTPIETPVRATS